MSKEKNNSKADFNFDLQNLSTSNSSKNFVYDSLYKFYAEQNKNKELTKQDKKVIRKNLQDKTASELDSNFIAALCLSGFVKENVSKDKFKPFAEVCTKMQASLSKAK